MNKHILIVVCPVGFGHVKRVLAVLKQLIMLEQLSQITIFGRKNGLLKISEILGITSILSGLEIIDMDAREPESVEGEFQKKVYNKIDPDFIWSDNFLFPYLYYNPRKVLVTGSFLWSEVQTNNLLYFQERKIIKDVSVRLIGTQYFSSDYLKNSVDFIPVGLYGYHEMTRSTVIGHSILISCGKSNTGINKMLQIVEEEIGEIDFVSEIDFYIEPEFVKYFPSKSNIKIADFSSRMFSQIGASIIRPGVGTLVDSLYTNARVFSFIEDNHEMKYNANMLKKLSIGESANSLKEAIIRAMDYLKSPKKIQNHIKMVHELDFHGIEDTAESIKRLLNAK